MLFVARIALLLLALLAMTPPAAAIETGTRAWLIHGQTVYDSYTRYRAPVGELEGGIRIRVERCHIIWCEIRAHGIRGWVWQDNISFGREPKFPIWPRFY